MSPGILGKKIGMTQIFRPDGQAVPVTLLKTGPCTVVQRKTVNSDGYDAVQLGLVEFVKPARMTKPEIGHLKKNGAEGIRFLKEFRLDNKQRTVVGASDLKPGDKVLTEEFKPSDMVDVTGHFERPWVCGRCSPASLPRGRRQPWFHVPSGSGFDRFFELSVACVPWNAHGRTYGR